jgi:hypothetical protein
MQLKNNRSFPWGVHIGVDWADDPRRTVRAWEGDMHTSEYQKRLSVMALVDPWMLVTPAMRKHYQPVFDHIRTL